MNYPIGFVMDMDEVPRYSRKSKGPPMKRSQNFSVKDTEILVKLIKKYMPVVESRQSDQLTWRKKKRYWLMICHEFNSLTHQSRRVAVIKKKWENIKKLLKCKLVSNQMGLNQLELEVMDLIGASKDSSESCNNDRELELKPDIDSLSNPSGCDLLEDSCLKPNVPDCFYSPNLKSNGLYPLQGQSSKHSSFVPKPTSSLNNHSDFVTLMNPHLQSSLLIPEVQMEEAEWDSKLRQEKHTTLAAQKNMFEKITKWVEEKTKLCELERSNLELDIELKRKQLESYNTQQYIYHQKH